MRATKIIATLGPATSAPERIEALLRVGVDTVRLNFSHGSHDDHARLVELVRETSYKLNRHVAVLQDLQGPRIRTGPLKGRGPVELRLGEELLIRHRCYHPLLEPVLALFKGLAHVTGGGLPGKVPSILPDNLAAEFNLGSWNVPPIFTAVQARGQVSDPEMFRVFNMGLGMVAVCDQETVATVLDTVPDTQVVGSIIPRTGNPQVNLV